MATVSFLSLLTVPRGIRTLWMWIQAESSQAQHRPLPHKQCLNLHLMIHPSSVLSLTNNVHVLRDHATRHTRVPQDSPLLDSMGCQWVSESGLCLERLKLKSSLHWAGWVRPQKTRLKAENVHTCGGLTGDALLPPEALQAQKTDVGLLGGGGTWGRGCPG